MWKILILLIIFSITSLASNRWPNHDISTLRLLQIVHRHGDRAPLGFAPKDPFQNESYWPQGIGELTSKGKYRMYKLGQFIRQEYGSYLGDKYSPREVYVRSSLSDRCIESASCLLSGAYPPQQNSWKWNEDSNSELGNIWQPFPIQTFMPQDDDLVLNQEKSCPVIEKEGLKIYNRSIIKQFDEKNRELYDNISKISGVSIDNVLKAGLISDVLKVELDHKYIWKQFWTEEQMKIMVEKLLESLLIVFRYSWDSPIIKRLRAGGLVKELNNNLAKTINKQNNKKLYVYSTHDSQLAVLMHSINIFNDKIPTFGATLLFELHQKNSISIGENHGYFVRAFYHNETEIGTGIPHPIRLNDCQNSYDCPLDEFFNSTKHLLYEDFDKECNQTFA